MDSYQSEEKTSFFLKFWKIILLKSFRSNVNFSNSGFMPALITSSTSSLHTNVFKDSGQKKDFYLFTII